MLSKTVKSLTFLIGLIVLMMPALPTYAATLRLINVDNIDDNNPGAGCTLREAINLANSGAGAGPAANGCTVLESGNGSPVAYQINLPAYTYTLTGTLGNDDNSSGDLDIRANLTLNGLGPGNTIIDGNRIDRVIHIPVDDLAVTISGVTIRNGFLPTLPFPTGNGGGIGNISTSTVNIINSVIRDNETSGTEVGNGGGGIKNFLGTMIIRNSIITNNQSTGGVSSAGAGIRNQVATMYIFDSVISNNTATGACCGGILNNTGGILTMVNSFVTGNSSQRDAFGGGGIMNESGVANIINSTISGNSSRASGAGIYMRISTSPLTSTLNLMNVTITNNTADSDGNGIGDGGGIYREAGDINLKNSILAQNIDVSGQNPDMAGVIFSKGYNLIGSVGTTIFAGNTTGDQYGDPNNTTPPNLGALESPTLIDPLLNSLTGNPPYHPLEAGSPAIDRIPTSDCTLLISGPNLVFNNGDPNKRDQAGVYRPQQLGCDVGAAEFVIPTDLKVTKSVTPKTVLAGQVLTYTLIFTNTGPGLATEVFITDTIPSQLSNVNITGNSGATITNTSSGPQLVWQVETLAPNQTGIITLTGQVSPTLKPPAQFSNTVRLTTTTVETNTTNNTAIAGVNTMSSDLAITKTVTPATNVTYHGEVTYTITLKNNSSLNIPGIILTDTLPLNISFARWIKQPVGANITSNHLTWSGTVSASQALTLAFVAKHQGDYGETIVNSAVYSYSGRSASSNSASFTVQSAPGGPLPGVFLPLVIKQPLTLPDLVVKSLVAKDNDIIVTLKNVGNAPTFDAFWVDVYINPNTAPNRVNQHWKQLSIEGLVWIVPNSLLPGEELTLTIGGQYFSFVNSQMGDLIPVGTPVYAQVDSIKLNGDFGGVLENHEFLGGRYNNIAVVLAE